MPCPYKMRSKKWQGGGHAPPVSFHINPIFIEENSHKQAEGRCLTLGGL